MAEKENGSKKNYLKVTKQVLLGILIGLIAKGYTLYLKARAWSLEQNFKGKHVSISFGGGTLKATITDHRDYTEALEKQIKALQKTHKSREVIKYALKHSRPKTTRIGLFNSGPEKVNWIMTSLCLNPMDYAPIDLLLQDYSPTLTLLKKAS